VRCAHSIPVSSSQFLSTMSCPSAVFLSASACSRHRWRWRWRDICWMTNSNRNPIPSSNSTRSKSFSSSTSSIFSSPASFYLCRFSSRSPARHFHWSSSHPNPKPHPHSHSHRSLSASGFVSPQSSTLRSDSAFRYNSSKSYSSAPSSGLDSYSAGLKKIKREKEKVKGELKNNAVAQLSTRTAAAVAADENESDVHHTRKKISSSSSSSLSPSSLPLRSSSSRRIAETKPRRSVRVLSSSAFLPPTSAAFFSSSDSLPSSDSVFDEAEEEHPDDYNYPGYMEDRPTKEWIEREMKRVDAMLAGKYNPQEWPKAMPYSRKREERINKAKAEREERERVKREKMEMKKRERRAKEEEKRKVIEQRLKKQSRLRIKSKATLQSVLTAITGSSSLPQNIAIASKSIPLLLPPVPSSLSLSSSSSSSSSFPVSSPSLTTSDSIGVSDSSLPSFSSELFDPDDDSSIEIDSSDSPLDFFPRTDPDSIPKQARFRMERIAKAIKSIIASALHRHAIAIQPRILQQSQTTMNPYTSSSSSSSSPSPLLIDLRLMPSFTLHRLRLSTDFRQAVCLWTAGRASVSSLRSISSTLDNSLNLIRAAIAKHLNMKYVPNVRFQFDIERERENWIQQRTQTDPNSSSLSSSSSSSSSSSFSSAVPSPSIGSLYRRVLQNPSALFVSSVESEEETNRLMEDAASGDLTAQRLLDERQKEMDRVLMPDSYLSAQERKARDEVWIEDGNEDDRWMSEVEKWVATESKAETLLLQEETTQKQKLDKRTAREKREADKLKQHGTQAMKSAEQIMAEQRKRLRNL